MLDCAHYHYIMQIFNIHKQAVHVLTKNNGLDSGLTAVLTKNDGL